MGSIVLNNLKSTDKVSKDFTYVDLHLDIAEAPLQVGGKDPTPSGRDIEVSYDEFAIKNSLINIFNTIPGQRFLIPEFGCDLYGYLFEPVTDMTGRMIARTVLQAIQRWEPRVVVSKVNVEGFPDDHEYRITVIVVIPTLKIQTDLTGILSTNGFAEVKLSRSI